MTIAASPKPCAGDRGLRQKCPLAASATERLVFDPRRARQVRWLPKRDPSQPESACRLSCGRIGRKAATCSNIRRPPPGCITVPRASGPLAFFGAGEYAMPRREGNLDAKRRRRHPKEPQAPGRCDTHGLRREALGASRGTIVHHRKKRARQIDTSGGGTTIIPPRPPLRATSTRTTGVHEPPELLLNSGAPCPYGRTPSCGAGVSASLKYGESGGSGL